MKVAAAYDRRVDVRKLLIGAAVGNGLTVVACPLCGDAGIRWGRKGRRTTVYAHLVDLAGKHATMRVWCEFTDHHQPTNRREANQG